MGARAINTPHGVSAVCTEERSQFQNKQQAISKLKAAMTLSNVERETKAYCDAKNKLSVVEHPVRFTV